MTDLGDRAFGFGAPSYRPALSLRGRKAVAISRKAVPNRNMLPGDSHGALPLGMTDLGDRAFVSHERFRWCVGGTKAPPYKKIPRFQRNGGFSTNSIRRAEASDQSREPNGVIRPPGHQNALAPGPAGGKRSLSEWTGSKLVLCGITRRSKQRSRSRWAG